MTKPNGYFLRVVSVALLFRGVHGYSLTNLDPSRTLKPSQLEPAIAKTENHLDDKVSRRATGTTSLTSPMVATRAAEIMGIVGGQILSPLVVSILQNGFPSDWETFWSQGSAITNAQRIAMAAEKLGPTYVKFCQALASRPDVIPKSLASALEVLQDEMEPFDNDTARMIIRSELQSRMSPETLEQFLDSFGNEPVGSASIGQVYKGYIKDYGDVAVKVKRLGVREVVERDAAMLRSIASLIESIPGLPMSGTNRLVATELVQAVDEFFSRIFEELDYRREAENCAEFGALYSARNRKVKNVQVIVPKIFPQFCTENVLVMQWLEGTKLTDVDTTDRASVKENIEIISVGIACTLSQLLETGRLHADPHAGNLLKVVCPEGNQLAYLDFGILSDVPPQVRDGLVCAVSYLVFARDVQAVASLFGELQLLPADVMEDPNELAALKDAMELTLGEALVYETNPIDASTQIPILKFDKLLSSLTRLVPRFRFQLPPYFINNARALSTLEGIARSLDPSFNVFQVMYPFALTKLLTNPTNSHVVDNTLQNLIRDPISRRVDATKIIRILKDSSRITGYSLPRVLFDIIKTKGGRKLTRNILAEEMSHRMRLMRSHGRTRRPSARMLGLRPFHKWRR